MILGIISNADTSNPIYVSAVPEAFCQKDSLPIWCFKSYFCFDIFVTLSTQTAKSQSRQKHQN